MNYEFVILYENWLTEFGELVAKLVAQSEDEEWMKIRPTHKGQQDVADLRAEIGDHWTNPTIVDSYIFLVSEVGEVGDVLLRRGYGNRTDYIRNNPNKKIALAKELGDVYLMLCTLATCLEIDLDEALEERIEFLRGKYG